LKTKPASRSKNQAAEGGMPPGSAGCFSENCRAIPFNGMRLRWIETVENNLGREPVQGGRRVSCRFQRCHRFIAYFHVLDRPFSFVAFGNQGPSFPCAAQQTQTFGRLPKLEQALEGGDGV